MMRIEKGASDEADRRVWLRDVEVPDWVVADEFRRVVITSFGTVLNGDVYIERLERDKPRPTPEPEQISVPEIPAHSFEVNSMQDYTRVVIDWEAPPPPAPFDALTDGHEPASDDAIFDSQGF